MTTFRTVRAAFAVASLCAAMALAAAAQGPSKIAIINIQQAIEATAEGRKAGTALEARFAPRQSELQTMETQIQALQKQLSDPSGALSAQAKSDLTSQLQARQRDYSQAGQNAESDFQQAQTELLNTIGAKVMPILQQYASQHGYTLVMDVSLRWPQSPLLYFDPGTNITADIVKLYDQAHPVAR